MAPGFGLRYNMDSFGSDSMTFMGFQKMIEDMYTLVWGPEAMVLRERTMRSLEEQIELAQAVGLTEDEVKQIVRYVFSRPPGEPGQEIAGSLITLFAMAQALGVDSYTLMMKEINKVIANRNEYAEKHKNKPTNIKGV